MSGAVGQVYLGWEGGQCSYSPALLLGRSFGDAVSREASCVATGQCRSSSARLGTWRATDKAMGLWEQNRFRGI